MKWPDTVTSVETGAPPTTPVTVLTCYEVGAIAIIFGAGTIKVFVCSNKFT